MLLLITPALVALGLVGLNVGTTDQVKVHALDLSSHDLKIACDLRTAVFSPHLEAPYSRIVQGRAWAESIKEKSKVLIARAAGEFAAALLRDEEKFAGHPLDDLVIGTVDMLLVPSLGLGGDGRSCCYVSNACVDPCARRRGVARLMMDVIDDIAPRELGASSLALHVDRDNVPAVRLYESVGFRDMDVVAEAQLVDHFSSAPFVVGDEGDQRLMVKLLGAAAPPAVGVPPGGEQAAGQQAAGTAPDGWPLQRPPADIGARQDAILSMGLNEQIEDLERLLASLKLTGGVTPDEIAQMQTGLDSMRAQLWDQEVAKKAWLAVLASRCETGDSVACETLSVEDNSRSTWLASRAQPDATVEVQTTTAPPATSPPAISPALGQPPSWGASAPTPVARAAAPATAPSQAQTRDFAPAAVPAQDQTRDFAPAAVPAPVLPVASAPPVASAGAPAAAVQAAVPAVPTAPVAPVPRPAVAAPVPFPPGPAAAAHPEALEAAPLSAAAKAAKAAELLDDDDCDVNPFV